MSDWTDHNQRDPGVTMLELLAWSVAALFVALGFSAYLRRRRDSEGRPP